MGRSQLKLIRVRSCLPWRHYACVQDGILTMSYLFKKRQIAVKDIGSIRFKDDVYTVYDRKKGKAGTINALATGIDRVIGELNRNHVNFE